MFLLKFAMSANKLGGGASAKNTKFLRAPLFQDVKTTQTLILFTYIQPVSQNLTEIQFTNALDLGKVL